MPGRDVETLRLLAAIDHAPSRHAVLAERALLAALGGNCHSPIAVLTCTEGAELTLRAALLSPDGAERVEAVATFAATDLDGPARLAAQLLTQAGPAIRAHFDPPGG
jgi:hydroxymethylbilane synthase